MKKETLNLMGFLLLLLAGLIIPLVVLNIEHKEELNELKTQIENTQHAPGVVTFPDGEYFIIRYYPL